MAGTGLRLVVWMGLGFLSGLWFLLSLFTFALPPANVWAVFWSGGALVLLAFGAIPNSRSSG